MESQSNLKDFYSGKEVYIYKKDGNFKVGIIVGESDHFVFLKNLREGEISISKEEIVEIKPNQQKRGER